MPKFTIGAFKIDVWEGGYPVRVEIEHEGRKLHGIRHEQLPDLLYAVEKAIHEARRILPEKDRGEIMDRR